VDRRDRDHLVSRYDERLARYGDSIETLASGTHERRRMRFEVLVELGLCDGCSVLDVGCGFGDFFGYLSDERGVSVSYCGLDVNPALIDIARRKYPAGEFLIGDVQIDEIPSADFIVSSGAFNLRLQHGDNYAYAGDIMRRCFERSRRGVAIDFLSSYVDFERPETFHYEPERIFSMAKKLTKRVSLRHDYPLFEFCVYLRPDFSGWQRS
jgi:ubiquinone/menaquinone biosynthesis C-methylase UbiE